MSETKENSSSGHFAKDKQQPSVPAQRDKGDVVMEEDQRKDIEEIISKMKCPKDFECCKSNFTTMCKTRDIGLEMFVECREEKPQFCKFSLSFAYDYYCKCPLRVYVAKQLKK